MQFKSTFEFSSYTSQNGNDQYLMGVNLMLARCGIRGTLLHLVMGGQTYIMAVEIIISVLQITNNLPQDPAIQILGLYPNDALSYHKDLYSTRLTAALFLTSRDLKIT